MYSGEQVYHEVAGNNVMLHSSVPRLKDDLFLEELQMLISCVRKRDKVKQVS